MLPGREGPSLGIARGATAPPRWRPLRRPSRQSYASRLSHRRLGRRAAASGNSIRISIGSADGRTRVGLAVLELDAGGMLAHRRKDSVADQPSRLPHQKAHGSDRVDLECYSRHKRPSAYQAPHQLVYAWLTFGGTDARRGHDAVGDRSSASRTASSFFFLGVKLHRSPSVLSRSFFFVMVSPPLRCCSLGNSQPHNSSPARRKAASRSRPASRNVLNALRAWRPPSNGRLHRKPSERRERDARLGI